MSNDRTDSTDSDSVGNDPESDSGIDALQADQQGEREEPEWANLDDGGALALNGTRAGTITADHVDGAATAPRLRDRDAALDGSVPLFICQRGRMYFEREPEVLASLHAGHGDALALGIAVRLPRLSPALSAARLDVPVAQVRIADPMGFIMFADRLTLDPSWPARQHHTNAPYLRQLRGQPSSYASALLNAQRAAGANLLLTSGRAIDGHSITTSFNEIAAEADELATQLRPGERLALNLTLPMSFLQNQQVFEVVLDELSELDQFNIVYMRIQRPNPPDAAAPLADPAALNRLVDLGIWAELHDVALIHAQSGLVGWLMLGSGATGFSTGGLPSDQMFKSFVRGGGGGYDPVERHFERSILHPVSAATHDAMVAQGAPYQDYPTRWGQQALGAASYNHQLSVPHYLFSVGWLTADTVRSATPRGGWRSGVRRTVRAAHSAAPNLGLGGRENPAHLASWNTIA